MAIVVTELTQTCPSCPSQWEGKTEDGRAVYIRYRSGILQVGLGRDMNAAVEAAVLGESGDSGWERILGGRLDGYLNADLLVVATSGYLDLPIARY